jgi:phage shock protein PspC (stress-responsive transcriptional regulator)
VRDPDDQVVAGVCAAFGRYTDTDPVLWRVAVAVLALFGGAGLALYALGWLLVPRTGQPQSVAERALRRQDRSVTVAGVLAAVVVGAVLLALLDNGPGAGALLVLGGVAYLVARERRDPGRLSASPGAPAPADQQLPEAHVPAAAPRVRSRLGAVTLSLAVVLTGVLLAVREAGGDEVTGSRIVAVALLVLGTGVLVGAWWGRARWLIPVGVAVALLLGAVAAAERADLTDGLGERSWRAVDGGDYALGAGDATLDLRSLRGLEDAGVDARVGFGELTVLVPRGMSVDVTADIGLGELEAPGIERNDGDAISEQFVVGSTDDVTVTLHLEVGVGQIEVRYVTA